MRVEWTEPALEDLAAIRDYIAKDSPNYARQLVEKVFARTDNLESYPESGRRVGEAESKNIRELIPKVIDNDSFDGPKWPPRSGGTRSQTLGHLITRIIRA